MSTLASSADRPVAPANSWWSNQRNRWRASFGHTASQASEVELVQRRIYLLPTSRGLFLIVTAVVLLLVGINYQLSLAFVVAFLLAGLMQAALLVSYRNLRGLVVRAGRSPRCKPGETLLFPVAIASPDRRREGISLRAEHALASQPRAVDANHTITVPLSLVPMRRGVAALGRVVVDTSAPYGLIRAWSYVHFEWVGIVEAQPESPPPVLPLQAGDGDDKNTSNAHVAHDPDSLRDYAPGDSLKRVAWKRVAKSGDWYTRTGDSGHRQEIELSWQAITLSDTEARLSRIAAWLMRAHNENCAYALLMPNGYLPLADGSQQYADAMLLVAIYPLPLTDVRGLR